MEINVEWNAGACTVTLGGELNIYTATALKDALMQPVGECDEIEIGLSEVSDIDTAGLQVLMLAKREALAGGRKLRLSGHSQAVMELLELYNLGAFFGDPVLIPAGKSSDGAARGNAGGRS